MRAWLRKVVTLGLASVAALAASLIVGSTPPAAADVTPQAYECLDNHFCLYQDINGQKLIGQVPASAFFDCAIVPAPAGVSSVYNRTIYDIELWDLDEPFLIGTAVKGKWYGYLGSGGNDALDVMASPPCIN